MRGWIAVAVALVLLAQSTGAQAAPDVPVVNSTAPGKAQASRVVKASGIITAVDRVARTVTIVGKDGQAETISVSPKVRRFDEVAVGDTVEVELQQGLALEFLPPGEKPIAPELITGEERSSEAQAPGGSTASWMRATVTVKSIDPKSRAVVFMDPRGRYHRVVAGSKVRLEKLKVGDMLIATYFESLAITLEKAPSEPAKK
jgi:hypothetical protein